MPPGQKSGHPPDSSQVNEFPLVSTSSCTFRHFISGSLALVSLNLLALSPVHAERSRRRGFARRARDRGAVRDRAPLAEPLRADDRRATAQMPPEAARDL